MENKTKTLKKLEKKHKKAKKACKQARKAKKRAKQDFLTKLEELNRLLKPHKKALKKAKKQQNAACANCSETKKAVHDYLNTKTNTSPKAKSPTAKANAKRLKKIANARAKKKDSTASNRIVTNPLPVSDNDNLKLIEGIGPKIEQLLKNAGIRTFTKLATVPVQQVKQILVEAGPRFYMHDPTTWNRQARLAADGAMEELKKLQNHLKGGREVK